MRKNDLSLDISIYLLIGLVIIVAAPLRLLTVIREWIYYEYLGIQIYFTRKRKELGL
jgi:hypothetical protein